MIVISRVVSQSAPYAEMAASSHLPQLCTFVIERYNSYSKKYNIKQKSTSTMYLGHHPNNDTPSKPGH